MTMRQTNGNSAVNGVNGLHTQGFRYAAFKMHGSGASRIGSLDVEAGRLLPLTYRSGTYIQDLYEVINASKEDVVQIGAPIPLSDVDLLPPISGRDILAVGKNYVDHAQEFHASGYDSSDKVAQPSHPVIFTKRSTSIIAHNAEIYPHPEFTESLDYEGEIGVIVGKTAFHVAESDAMDYVWGYTIINDVTAREKQRDHKQFFLGKSADTFCPMGPVAMRRDDLPEVLEVTTKVNGEQRQRGSTKNLIFSVPRLIATISAGQTLQPGDVIATGTPAGVGFGFNPPIWLHSGDEVEIAVTGLGSLKNKVGGVKAAYSGVTASTPLPFNTRALDNPGLVEVNGKQLFCNVSGAENGKPTLFIHGLGGTHDYFRGLAENIQDKRRLIAFDFEGHGLSPVARSRTLSIESLAIDAAAVASYAGVRSGLTVVAHSLGCLIAMRLVVDHPELVDELVLLGPPPSPLPAAGASGTYARAALVRQQGMAAVAETVARGGTSVYTQQNNPLAFVATRLSLLSQEPEGYAKACYALADSSQVTIDVSSIKAKTLLLTGTDDKVSPPGLCETYNSKISGSKVVVLDNVAHWHLFEDHPRTVKAVCEFLS